MKPKLTPIIVLLLVLVSVNIIAMDISRETLHKDLIGRIDESPDEYVDVLIKYMPTTRSSLINDIKKMDVTRTRQLTKYVQATIRASELKKLKADERIAKIYPNRKYSMTLLQSKDLIKPNNFYNSGYNGDGIKVAVLDTGITNYNNIFENRIIESVDFTGSNNVVDNNGHGTHIASIIAGNDAAYKGIAPKAQLYNFKVLDNEGYGSAADIIAALDYATIKNVDIISMSFGAPLNDPEDPLLVEIKDAVDKGVVVIVSAGNCGETPYLNCGGFKGVTTPGISPEAITVGAVDKNKQHALFSGGEITLNNIKPDVVAPGVDITAVSANGIISKSGTSISVPFVAGAAALMLDKYSYLTPAEIKERLMATAEDLGEFGKDTYYGAGLINLEKLFTYKSSEALEYDVNYEETINVFNPFSLAINIIDTTPVNSITGYVIKPNNDKVDLVFNNNQAVFEGTNFIGYYEFYVSINYGSNLITSFSGSFKVIGEEIIKAEFVEVNLPETVSTINHITGNVKIKNIYNEPITASVQLHAVKDTAVYDYYATDFMAVQTGEELGYTIDFEHNLMPGEYTLMVIADYKEGVIVQEKNLLVEDVAAPSNINSKAQQTYFVDEPVLLTITANDDTVLQGTVQITTPNNEIKSIELNNLYQIDKEQTLTATFVSTNLEGSYSYEIKICDKNNLCSLKQGSFEVIICNKKKLLLVLTDEYSSLDIEKDLCIARWYKSYSGTPHIDVLNKFDYLIWTSNSLNENDAENLLGYENNIALIGDNIANNNFYNYELKELTGSSVNEEGIFNVDYNYESLLEKKNLLKKTRNHYLTKGISIMEYDTSVSLLPDSLIADKSVALMGYNDDTTAMTALEGSRKVLFVAFDINALSSENKALLMDNILTWLTIDTINDISLMEIKEAYYIEGKNNIPFKIGSNNNFGSVKFTLYVDDNPADTDIFNINDNNGQEFGFSDITLSSGEHTLRIEANSDFVMEEINYINNVAERKVNVVKAIPDFIADKVEYNYKEGKLNADVYIKNIGGKAETPFVKVYLDGNLIHKNYVAVEAGKISKTSFSYPTSQNNHMLSVKINEAKDIVEINYDNNNYEEKLYICNKGNILVVSDNDAAYNGINGNSSKVIEYILKKKEYCVDYWDEKEKGYPSQEFVNGHDILIWSTDNYWNTAIDENDMAIIENFKLPVFVEGSEVAYDHMSDGFTEEIFGVSFEKDLEITSQKLGLAAHKIFEGISAISVKSNKPFYPDSVKIVKAEGLAQWPGYGQAMTYNKTRKSMFMGFAFGMIDNTATKEKLLLNIIEFIKPNHDVVIKDFSFEKTGKKSVKFKYSVENKGDYTENIIVTLDKGGGEIIVKNLILAPSEIKEEIVVYEYIAFGNYAAVLTVDFNKQLLTKKLNIGFANSAPTMDSLEYMKYENAYNAYSTFYSSGFYTDVSIGARVKSYDNDKDKITVTFKWAIDKVDGNKEIIEDVQTYDGKYLYSHLDAEKYNKHDKVHVEITASDGYSSSIYIGTTYAVLNSVPEIISKEIGPVKPTAKDKIIGAVSWKDKDNDNVTATITGYVNYGNKDTQLIKQSNNQPINIELDSKLYYYKKGDSVKYSVTLCDNDNGCSSSNSNELTIGDIKPECTIKIIGIDGFPNIKDDFNAELYCTDYDKDEIKAMIKWYKKVGDSSENIQTDEIKYIYGGEGSISSKLDKSKISDGMTIFPEAYVYFGLGIVSTEPITLINYAPEILSLAFVPENPKIDDEIKVCYVVDDKNKDNLEGTFALYKGEEIISTTNLDYTYDEYGGGKDICVPLQNLVYTKGDKIKSKIELKDYAETTTHEQIITIQNSKPVVKSVSFEKGKYYVGEDIKVNVVAEDADNDQLSFAYRWYLNGVEMENNADTIKGDKYGKGVSIIVKVIAFDGEEYSDEAESNKLVINTKEPPYLKSDYIFTFSNAEPTKKKIDLDNYIADKDSPALIYSVFSQPDDKLIESCEIDEMHYLICGENKKSGITEVGVAAKDGTDNVLEHFFKIIVLPENLKLFKAAILNSDILKYNSVEVNAKFLKYINSHAHADEDEKKDSESHHSRKTDKNKSISRNDKPTEHKYELSKKMLPAYDEKPQRTTENAADENTRNEASIKSSESNWKMLPAYNEKSQRLIEKKEDERINTNSRR